MIGSFKDAKLERFWLSGVTRGLPAEILRPLADKLAMLAFAEMLNDLRVPPGNRLEALKGDLAGCHSIRVNQRWRLVFRWSGNEAHEIRLMDYH